MQTYICLLDWTEHGIRNFDESVDRYEAAQEEFQKLGVSFKDIYWTLGEHDLVAIVSAPDDETLTCALLMLGKAGNVRTKTMRGLSAGEMRSIINRVA